MSTDDLRAEADRSDAEWIKHRYDPTPPKAAVLGFRNVLTNREGARLTLHLKADGPPLWRQPGEFAKDYADNHHEYGKIGPWTVVQTERCA